MISMIFFPQVHVYVTVKYTRNIHISSVIVTDARVEGRREGGAFIGYQKSACNTSTNNIIPTVVIMIK